MLNYKHLQEASSSEKHHVLAFGRMNPITSGHEAVVNKLHSVAKERNASHSLVVSHSQDAKKNPLSGEQKVTHAKAAFPKTNVSLASKTSPTILHHAAAAHRGGATHLHVIAGSDRHEEMHNLLHKYNGKDSAHGNYNFKSITVHSSGARDPDSEGAGGISASKMREHAASSNKTEFHKGAPSKMTLQQKDAMYNDVRKGMNIKEQSMQETLRPEMGAGVYINDFMKSTNPRFNNKTPQERRMMAMGAYMAAKAKSVKEEVQIDELSTELLGKYKKAAGINASAADKTGDFKTGNKRFSGIIKATKKQFVNDTPKQTVKEGALQGNIGGGDSMNTTTASPSSPTAKSIKSSKKVKDFKFFTGESDVKTNQSVKEATKEKSEYDYEGNMARRQLKSLIINANRICDNLKDDDNLAEWVQSKITLAADYISTVSDYLSTELDEAAGVNVDKVNSADQEPHEEKFETFKKSSKIKKEETMKSYKDFLQTLDEKLVGKQKKLDKNHNDKIDAEDFKLLRKEEVEQIDEYESDSSGVYRNTKKATYGTSYKDPAGADETSSDMKKAEKKTAGRKFGQGTGSYKPRKTMSKLKSAGATYK